MKNLIVTTFLAFGLVLAPAVAQAEIAVKAQTAVAQPQQTLFDIDANAPLAVRKAFVETNLRDLLAQLTAFYTRAQIASDRLGTNGIDTTASETALVTTRAALVTAKTELDIFSATPADDKPATAVALRTHAKAAEDSLRTAKTSLIESITALQLTLKTN